MLLSAALRRDEPELSREAMREAVARIEREIENLRSIITELRPAALDELGLRAAIESLLDRASQHNGLEIERDLAVGVAGDDALRLEAALETAVYRLVQEALTNVVKHANATRVRVKVAESEGELSIEVEDDGDGFDPATVERGFGLAGMSERVSLAGGSLDVGPCEGGTLLSARLPAHRPIESAAISRADQAAS